MLEKVKTKIDKAVKVLNENLSTNKTLLQKIFDSFLEISDTGYRQAFHNVFDDQKDLEEYESITDAYATLGLLLRYETSEWSDLDYNQTLSSITEVEEYIEQASLNLLGEIE